MNSHSLLRSALILTLSLASGALTTPAAHAAPDTRYTPPKQRSESISHAVGIYVTERGQQYFKENLQEALFRMGTEVTEGNFENWAYQAEEPLILDRLPVHLQKFSGTLGTVRDIIAHWLRGFELGDPLIQAEVKNVQYSLKLKNFGMHIDPEATSHLIKGRGVVMVFEAEIPQIRIDAESVRGSDSNNAFLETFGANHVFARLQKGSVPLKIRIPMSLELNAENILTFKLLELSTNLSELQLDLGFDHPLQLPLVRVMINGQKMTLNHDKIEQTLLEQKPRLLKALQAYLEKMAEERIPPAINDFVASKYPHPFSDVNKMDPPGAEHFSREEKYTWGIKPEQIRLTPHYLMIGMSAYIDDPKSTQPDAAVSRRQTKTRPMLNHVDPTTFDAAVAINEDLINRILGLGYQRGYFNKLQVSEGAPLSMLQAPEFRFDGSLPRDRGKLHIKVSQKMEGFTNQLAVKHQLTFEMDVVAHLIHTPEGQVQVALDGIDLGSINIDQRSIRSPFEGMVNAAVKKKLADADKELRRHHKIIVEKLPIPTNLPFTPPLRVKDFEADENGYIVIYFEYDLEN
jgi:hypothetical protein